MLSGACTQPVPSAIANGDRPAAPKPAIASPVPAPLTLKSIAGTYKGVIDEQQLAGLLREAKKRGSGEGDLQRTEVFMRLTIDQSRFTINVDGTFTSQSALRNDRGHVKIDGNKLIFTTKPANASKGTVATTNACHERECSTVTVLEVSADRKTLLPDKSQRHSKLLRGYVKQ